MTTTPNNLSSFFFVPGLPKHLCPGMPWECVPPAACARDPTTGRAFCCDPKSVCFAGVATCASDGSTFQCGTGTNTWCCTSDTESCTGSTGQTNICWSKSYDVLMDIGSIPLNETYSSLSSADPEATSWAFDPKSLIAATQTTSHTTSSTPSSTPSTTPSTTPSSTDTTTAPTTSASDASKAGASNTPSPTPSDLSSTSSSKSLSGGAIGGIVVGAVAAVVLVALAVFFLRRRRQRAESENKEGIPWAALPPQGPAHELPTGKQEPVHELAGARAVVELPGNERYR
ncbi:hypothetical protein VE01_07394 [Pseudogymnoascus verrucosus]|uniref:Mid2 domain-containing protein n=1 Tax=Pseudogymnoascus verrucosus TaxID=342668 RepID=A0A1B8GGY5_9PEZI|nr:uncharacterized protein VE01_07394 [Pseudogymnoascus verrucosus]OBT95092.1 hypothetical protein VE01_07394 [Pseudogymnoascus verrucosus]